MSAAAQCPALLVSAPASGQGKTCVGLAQRFGIPVLAVIDGSSMAQAFGALAAGLARNPNGGPSAEAVYRQERLTASFVHFYFPSNPAAAVALLRP